MSATIAFIAHDNQKNDLANLVNSYKNVFSRYHLIATENTGDRIEQISGLNVEKMLPGTVGGDAQIADSLLAGNVLAVFFPIDPIYARPDEPRLQPILRLCFLYNIPLATNFATAEAIAANLARSTVAHLIFNPVSGQGNSEEDLELIQSILSSQMDLHVHLTTPETSAQQLAKEAIGKNPDLIIASGGDGTVSAVAEAVVNTEIPLGIIPRGTANAFGAALGIGLTITPIRTACEIILAGKTRLVDAARCGDRPMVLLAGIGYEAETVEKADREAKSRWGALAYIMAGWQQLEEQQLFEVEIDIDGTIKEFQAGAITIANAAPPTSILAQGMGEPSFNDGLLEVIILTSSNKRQAIGAMISMLGAAILKSPSKREDLMGLRAARVKVTTNPPQKVVIDGEIIGPTPTLEIECLPGALTVLAPPVAPKQKQQDSSEVAFMPRPKKVVEKAFNSDIE